MQSNRILGLALCLALGACGSRGASRAAGSSPARDIRGLEVTYSVDGTTLKGYLARPLESDGKRPGVLIVHEWWGHNEYVRTRARELAEQGYVTFALDMYGDGKEAAHPADATAFMNEVMGNQQVMETRFRAALDVLHAAEGVDPARTAAMGYCMGGGIVLRMARETDELTAVASFHGSLGAALGAGDRGGVRYVLLAHGADDSFVDLETLQALKGELLGLPQIQSVVVEVYPGAVHGFTNPAATANGEKFDLPLRYDAAADRASWEAWTTMLRKAFPE